MKKALKVPKIIDAEEFATKARGEKIENCNWPVEFPYSPEVGFRIAHSGDALYVKYSVTEDCVMANVGEDNGEVWTDSCVEFFISFDDTGYYNFEFTCIGRMLLGFRKEKPNCVHADTTILDTIERIPSLGVDCFAEVIGDGQEWDIMVRIPVSAFFKHDFGGGLSGVSASANFYKCGDKLSKPHFLSWSPIVTSSPNFHCPEYFGDIVFE